MIARTALIGHGRYAGAGGRSPVLSQRGRIVGPAKTG